jgi:4-hydroxybenzoate polyprenyltransferase
MTGSVPVLLAIAARAGRATDVVTFPVDIVLALLLFVQFRILDDLADRSRDARLHPERALVRATSVRSIVFLGLVLASATMAILLFRHDPGPSSAYLILIILLSTWYVLRRERTLLGDHLLLAKYPAFVWIIATSRVGPAAVSHVATLSLSMLAVYLAACVYESLHDDRSPARERPALIAGEGVLLVATLAALSVRGPV